MSWLRRYRLQHYIRTSIWILPTSGIVAAVLSLRVIDGIEGLVDWRSGSGATSIRDLLGTLAGAMFTFIVFLSSTLLLVVQLASAQLSPRIIGVVFRDRTTRLTLTLFTYTFTFTLAVLVRIHGNEVPEFITLLAEALFLLSLGAFLFLVDRLGKTLRPSGALLAVALRGHKEIERVYPQGLSETRKDPSDPVPALDRVPFRTVLSCNGGVLLAFHHEGLVALARKSGCVIELLPEVGDFVTFGSPLFRIYGGKNQPSTRELCQSVALGQERTMEQDPAFAFRIVVDIASKALSPAINDPTTAVLAIDQLHHLLYNVGVRHLDQGVARDPSGALRLVYRTPDWEDFVCLAVTEIRQYGGTSIQVARRLRAMLENLSEALPPGRATLLRTELSLLRRSASRCFPEPEDQALANVSDLQGVGGKGSGNRTLATDTNASEEKEPR